MMFQKFASDRRTRFRRCVLAATSLAAIGAAQAAPRETVLYSFPNWFNGWPTNGFVMKSHGELFDMYAGSQDHTIGVRLTPPAPADHGRWTATVLDSGPGPFYRSSGDVVLGAHDVIYGFGQKWGSGPFSTACSFVYEFLPPPAGRATRAPKTIYEFKPALDGCEPKFGLAGDANGVLFGVKINGVNGATSVFRLAPPAAGQSQWTETDLYSFPLALNFVQATSRVIPGPNGALYGTAAKTPYEGDIVYRLTPPTNGDARWIRTDLYRFRGGKDADRLMGGLVFGPDGALYGHAMQGGRFNRGAVFRLSPPADGKTPWIETILYSFKGGEDGSFPIARPVFDAQGALYGITGGDAIHGSGNVFKLTPPSAGETQWSETVLHHFRGTATDGGDPLALTIDAKGALYGVAQISGADPNHSGVVFKIEQ